MKNVKKGFGQELDLENYEGRWSQEECNGHTKRGVFVKFSYLYIGELDYSDEQLHNAAIRATGNKDRADEKIKHSYSRVGWKYNDFPPIVGTDGKIRDGRTRIRAAILAGEQWIPVAIFVYREDETVNEFIADLSEGLISNDGLINRPTTFADLSEGGVTAVKSGAILHEKTAIYDLVYNEFEAERFISEKEIPALVDEIYDRVTRGEDAVIQLTREEVIAKSLLMFLVMFAGLVNLACLVMLNWKYMLLPVILTKHVYGVRLLVTSLRKLLSYFTQRLKFLLRSAKVILI
mgnify:CR=1 FL=1